MVGSYALKYQFAFLKMSLYKCCKKGLYSSINDTDLRVKRVISVPDNLASLTSFPLRVCTFRAVLLDRGWFAPWGTFANI